MVERWQFGIKSNGSPVHAHRLRSDAGFEAVVLDQGAILQSFCLPNGRNVSLGFENWESYESDPTYKGRIIGPNANRIENARFRIDGHEHRVTPNDGPHNLHSGPDGFDTQMWLAEPTESGLRLELESPDVHHDFPGTLRAVLNISLTGCALRLDMEATTNQTTPMNLTWHPYWNLSNNVRVNGHNLEVSAETYTKLENHEAFPIKGTLRDFTQSHPIGNVQLDCNYQNVRQARLTAERTTMLVTSSLPDMQVYTGDALPNARSGIALEPQFRPNDINFAQDSLLRPSEIYRHWIEYRFDEI